MSRTIATARTIASGRGIATGRAIASGRSVVGGTSNGLLNSLVAYYKLDEASGSRADATGRGNTLAENGGTVGSATGKINNAASFNAGAGANLEADKTDFILSDTAWTIALWVKVTSGAVDAGVFSISNLGSIDFGMRWSNTDNDLVPEGDMVDTGAGIGATLNTWQLVIFKSNGVNLYHSLNGTAFSVNSGVFPTGNFHVLDIGFDTLSLFTGLVDEFGKWNRALSNADAAALYNSGSGLSYGNFTT